MEKHTQTETAKNTSEKKIYTPPSMTEYGSITKLTQKAGSTTDGAVDMKR